jgi:hypothetical protein
VGSILPPALICGKEGLNPAMPGAWPLSLNGPVALISNMLDAESITTKKAMTKIMDWVVEPASVIVLRGCFGQMIGGFASRVPNNATAVHPGFRKGVLAMSCFGFPFGPLYEFANTKFNDWGDGAAYINEPQSRLPDWKQRFWTEEKYEKLVVIKKKWDPENRFIVHQGVNSDKVSDGICWDCTNVTSSSTSESTNDVVASNSTEISALSGMPDCSKTASPSKCQCAVNNCAADIRMCFADMLCAAGLRLMHTPLLLMSSAKGLTLLSCVEQACPNEYIV